MSGIHTSADLAHRPLGAPVTTTGVPAVEAGWKRRLGQILHTPDEKDVRRFLDGTATDALRAVAAEFNGRGHPAEVERDETTGGVSLVLPAEGVRNFIYGIQPASHPLPALTAMDAARPDLRHEARTWFSDGSRGYDVYGLTRDQLIADVLVQFDHYQSLVQSPGAALFAGAPEQTPE
ncbi:hypothetical protein [Tistrella sp.]|uniref:hypothetical protein n=1 Tax=Tistrella sp. TaxID=2024861 RepID=UPI0025D3BF84|nr:hypothetical protein [Tistrella sp.]